MKSIFFAAAVAVAMSSNTAEAFMKKSVTFESAGKTLAGDLYLPEFYSDGDRPPAVVVTGAWTTVKEQMAGTYAAELTARGYAALAFDFRSWGESSASAQYLENPRRKTEDINAAVNFLASLSEIDTDRIAGLGICASAGYMSDAALQNNNIKSLALVAPWLHDREIVNLVYGGEESVSDLIRLSRDAERSEQPSIAEAASMSNSDAIMYQVPYYTEEDRGLIPQYDNKFNLMSWEGWLTYDALKTADRLQKPTLLVHSNSAAIPQGATEYAKRMGDFASMRWLPDFTQFDFYDHPDAVTTSVDTVTEHFAQTL